MATRKMRTFEGGATRDSDHDKPDYEGYLSPSVIKRFGQYMLKHQQQADGSIRASDNWQCGQGIPQDAYIKSAFRHFMDWWCEHRGNPSREGIEDAACALLFNVMGYLHEHLKTKENTRFWPHPIVPEPEVNAQPHDCEHGYTCVNASECRGVCEDHPLGDSEKVDYDPYVEDRPQTLDDVEFGQLEVVQTLRGMYNKKLIDYGTFLKALDDVRWAAEHPEKCKFDNCRSIDSFAMWTELPSTEDFWMEVYQAYVKL